MSAGIKGTPITIPSNNVQPIRTGFRGASMDADGERFDETEDVRNTFEVRKSGVDAEKDLRDLLQSHIEDDEQGGAGEEEEDAHVDGMNVKLQPHQQKSRKWMREREEGKKYGGILADDMGLADIRV
jgi:SNF2 family DNA or RNA helicase